jgi:hypothetical protein
MNDTANMLRVLSARRTSLSLTVLLALGGAAHAETLQDPTRPATARAAAQAEVDALRLEAIMDSGTGRIAIVNGKIVRAGGRVGGALIETIGSDSIRYTRDGRTTTAHLAKSQQMQVRRTAASSGAE